MNFVLFTAAIFCYLYFVMLLLPSAKIVFII